MNEFFPDPESTDHHEVPEFAGIVERIEKEVGVSAGPFAILADDSPEGSQHLSALLNSLQPASLEGQSLPGAPRRADLAAYLTQQLTADSDTTLAPTSVLKFVANHVDARLAGLHGNDAGIRAYYGAVYEIETALSEDAQYATILSSLDHILRHGEYHKRQTFIDGLHFCQQVWATTLEYIHASQVLAAEVQ